MKADLYKPEARSQKPESRRLRSPFVFWLLASGFWLLFSGCITLKPRSHQPGQSAIILPEISVRQWGDNSCGAGALSTVLNYFHHPATEDDLNAGLKKGRHGGIVSIDLMLEARNRGFDARLVRGTPELVEESVRSGSPPILMLRILDAPGETKDLFHYIVVDGFDADRRLARMQFGDGTLRWASLESSTMAPVGGGVKDAWAGTDYATLIVQPRDPNRREDQTELRKAVALEDSGRLDEARSAYRTFLQTNPTSAVGWTNLGNVEARLGNYPEAEAAYRSALQQDGASRDAINNLAWVLLQMKRFEEAEQTARRAVSLPGPDDHVVLDTLAEILIERGKCAEAIETWKRAIAEVPPTRPQSREKLEQSLQLAEVSCP